MALMEEHDETVAAVLPSFTTRLNSVSAKIHGSKLDSPGPCECNELDLLCIQCQLGMTASTQVRW